MKFINKYKSPNFDKRKSKTIIKFIILHYTALKDENEAIMYMCNKKNKVSAHFLINKRGKIFNLVDIKLRAWHAGRSYWKDQIDLNSKSIGIEMDNSGHHNSFENYTLKQITSLFKLIKYISVKFQIQPNNILGHSDIAPYRKIDPGEKFPWKKLNQYNYNFLPKKISINLINKIEKDLKLSFLKEKKHKALYMLEKIGYDVNPAKRNKIKYKKLIKAYQMHFRQELISGILDKETYKTIMSHYNQMLT